MGDEKSTHPSLRPPLHGRQPEVPRTCSWALLDLYAYVADRENATSAFSVMSDGTRIRLTFCAAPPPLVSYLCVWCHGVQATEVNMRNTVLAAESDLLLLCVSLRSWERDRADYFVYKAAGGGKRGPSLTLLPDPSSFLVRCHNITLLAHEDVLGGRSHLRLRRHGEEAYFYMAILNSNAQAGDGHFNLCVFNSVDGKWTTRDVFVDCPCHLVISKVVALGEGGLLAFVDLWRGIIVCDVLGRKPPHYLPLPLPLFSPDNCFEDPLCSRDIVYVGGRLILVELRHISNSDSRTWSWEVSSWSRMVTHCWEEDWHHQHTIQSPSIAVDCNTDNVELLPKPKDSEGTLRPALGSLYVDHPTLSLTDTNVVYIMAKVSHRDKKALVLSIDMSTPRVQGLAVFDAERMVGYTYMQSRIPEYFHMASASSSFSYPTLLARKLPPPATTARPPSSPCRIPVPGCTGAVSSGLAWSAPRVRARPGAELRCLLRAVFLPGRRAPTHLTRTSCHAPWSASAIPVFSPRRVVSTKCCAMSIARTVFDEMSNSFCGSTSLQFASYVLYRAPSRRASWALDSASVRRLMCHGRSTARRTACTPPC